MVKITYDIVLAVSEVVNKETVKIGEVTDQWHLDKTSTREELVAAVDYAIENELITIEKFVQNFNSGSDIAVRAAFKSKFHAKDGKRAAEKEKAGKFDSLVAKARAEKAAGDSSRWDMLVSMDLVKE